MYTVALPARETNKQIETDEVPIVCYFTRSVAQRWATNITHTHIHADRFPLSRQTNHPVRLNRREVEETSSPLIHRHSRRRYHHDGLPDCAGGRDASKRLAGTTWKDDDATASAAIGEHLAQSAFLMKEERKRKGK